MQKRGVGEDGKPIEEENKSKLMEDEKSGSNRNRKNSQQEALEEIQRKK